MCFFPPAQNWSGTQGTSSPSSSSARAGRRAPCPLARVRRQSDPEKGWLSLAFPLWGDWHPTPHKRLPVQLSFHQPPSCTAHLAPSIRAGLAGSFPREAEMATGCGKDHLGWGPAWSPRGAPELEGSNPILARHLGLPQQGKVLPPAPHQRVEVLFQRRQSCPASWRGQKSCRNSLGWPGGPAILLHKPTQLLGPLPFLIQIRPSFLHWILSHLQPTDQNRPTVQKDRWRK